MHARVSSSRQTSTGCQGVALELLQLAGGQLKCASSSATAEQFAAMLVAIASWGMLTAAAYAEQHSPGCRM
jgi:hypothetical protein